MQTKTRKNHRTLKQTITAAIAITLIGCSTTKHRDERLTENLEKQNAVIDAAQAERVTDEVKTEIEKSEILKEAETRLSKALTAIKNANQTVISKMKPEDKDNCNHEQAKGEDDEE
ncbi:MAG: hypothetical protein AB7G93_04570 [Bdellovibrionales bacterium]